MLLVVPSDRTRESYVLLRNETKSVIRKVYTGNWELFVADVEHDMYEW